MQIAILGRQPKLSIAELESLYGANAIKNISENVCLVDTDDTLPQSRLGGTIKSARVLKRLENSDLEGCFKYIAESIPEYLLSLPDGKLQFGLSIYGDKAQKNWLLRQMLNLKKVIKQQGRSVRVIENKSEVLESATVLYNKLTGPLGWELLLIKDETDYILAQTTGVQNVDDYSKRDFDRPKRDAFNGMLPPKLAQIMINLCVGNSVPNFGTVILDPFCGTGVVLQEAVLMGFDVYGSDVNPRMIEYTDTNLLWLQKNIPNPIQEIHSPDGKYFKTEVADATSHKWAPLPNFVVCETYLGKPLTFLPKSEELNKVIDEANQIATRFLQNIAVQLKAGTRLCIALPAWYIGAPNTRFKHLKVLDHLTDMGYTRIDLKHANYQDLIYHRQDQIVARELIILEKV